MGLMDEMMDLRAMPVVTAVAVVALGGLLLWIMKGYLQDHRKGSSKLPNLPEVPGLPVLGNLLQLKEKKPHKTFTKWAKTYGPIYSIKIGSNRIVVLNSTEVAKEAMVTRFQSISTRKLTKALEILTANKCMVATSDYDNFHKTVKRHILTSLLGATAQKRLWSNRDRLIENTMSQLYTIVKDNPLEAVDLRGIFEPGLFGLSMKQAFGEDVSSVYVEEFGTAISREEIFNILVRDQMEGAIDVDWRDFFPYLKWVPNRSLEMKIEQIDTRRQSVMKSLIKEQSKQVTMDKEANCYLNYLSSEAKTLTEKQKAMLIWETIIETSDTTLVTTEWAMYELSKDPKRQDRLYQEILSVCGSEKVTEEKLSQLTYLSAVFHETLRKHNPVPVVPLRYVHEDTELGGHHVPAGSEIAINIYGCNMDEKLWENPEEWTPERFLDKKYDPSDLYKTMAFGGGKRVCAGSLQAMLIACTTIARLVQEFEWRLKDGEEANVDTMALTTRKLEPMLAFIKPRKQ